MIKTSFLFCCFFLSQILPLNTSQASPTEGALLFSKNPCVDQRGNFPDSDIIEEICVLTNQERAKRKLKPLTLDSSLSEVAQLHAEDMSKRDYFSHTSLNGDSPFDRIAKAHIKYRSAAENIARGYTTPKKTMHGWMNSAGHKRNILGPSYGKIGIGFYNNYWVQVFTN